MEATDRERERTQSRGFKERRRIVHRERNKGKRGTKDKKLK